MSRVCACAWAHVEVRGLRSPGTGVMHSRGSPNVGSRNRTWGLCKLSHLSGLKSVLWGHQSLSHGVCPQDLLKVPPPPHTLTENGFGISAYKFWGRYKYLVPNKISHWNHVHRLDNTTVIGSFKFICCLICMISNSLSFTQKLMQVEVGVLQVQSQQL